MKQIIQSYRTGELKLTEVPIPALIPGHVLVQTAFSVISIGTEGNKVATARRSVIGKARSRPDLVKQVLQTAQREGIFSTYQKVMNRLDEPVPLGYSAAGTVIALGTNVENFRVGDRVACGGESAGHAEVISVPINLCVKVPDAASLDEAAFTTLGAIALQGVRQAEAKIGESFVVIGLGLVGQLTVQLLKACGCHVIGVDLDPVKVDLATKLGADGGIPRTDAKLESKIYALTRGRGADGVIITAASESNDPIELATALCRDRGCIVAVGNVKLELPRQAFYDKELRFLISRSYGPGRYDPVYEEKGIDYPVGYVRWTEKRNMEAFVDQLAQGIIRIQEIISHRFKFEDAERAYDLLTKENKESHSPLGILFEYEGSSDYLSLVTHRVDVQAKVAVQKNASNQSHSTIGIGLIGAGSFARKYLIPELARNASVRLCGVATARGFSGHHVANKFGFGYSTGNYQDILEDPDTHCVFIATRHNLHAQLSIEALRAGKAVFVEKPLALCRDELNDISSAQSETSGQLLVGFNRRFSKHIIRIKEFFRDRSEPIAIQYRVNAGYIEPDHWIQDVEVGGGRILGELCHFIDLVLHLSGSLLSTVSAIKMDNVGRYKDDNLLVNLSFEDGSVASISYFANGDLGLEKERMEVYCQGSVAVLTDFKRLELYTDGDHKVPIRNKLDKGHSQEIIAFVDSIKKNQDSPIPFHELYASTSATLAVQESLRLGLPVKPGLIPAE